MVYGAKNVFSFWHSGYESAPPIVKSCIDSWRKGCARDGFTHHLIDGNTLLEWESALGDSDGAILREFRINGKCWPDAKWRRYTDMLRLFLLKHFNGIWVDSTVLLISPINDWIPNSGSLRRVQVPSNKSVLTIENWLILSMEKSEVIDAWADFLGEFMLKAPRDAHQWKVPKWSLERLIHRINALVPKTIGIWFHPLLLKIRPRAPYYAAYFALIFILRKNVELNRIHRYSLFFPFEMDAWHLYNSSQRADLKMDEIDEGLFERLSLLPFVKLDWKRSPDRKIHDLEDGTVLKEFFQLSSARLS